MLVFKSGKYLFFYGIYIICDFLLNFGRVECWCGNSYGKYGQFPNDCNSKCSGNKNQLCGGGLRNSIYSLLSNATATAIGSTRGIACEGQTLNLQCPQEQKLTIASANFGRTDSTMCGLWSNTNCKSDQTAYFQKQCNNNKSCSAVASGGVFGDPCFGTPKYLGICLVLIYRY